ncbi:MAG: HEAT repeat domain-containing protein [Nannocystaceae bacterium]|nr:HEAT repeat domain-containing protein [bacterium]
MHKHIIASALALTAFTQTGCTIISHFVQKKKSDDAAAAEAADQKKLEATIAAKDLSKLKTECAGTAETGPKRDWCAGYQQVFTANASNMQCDTAWKEYNGSADIRTQQMTEAMALALADCEKWDLYFTELVPNAGSIAIRPMDERLEKAFLTQTTSGGDIKPEVGSAVLGHLLGLQQNKKATGTCDDYLAASDIYSDNATYVRILVEKKCTGAVQIFEQGLLSDDGYVRANSCTGLAKVGEAKHIKPLENLAWTDKFEGPNYTMPVRESCRDAYGKLETRLSM